MKNNVEKLFDKYYPLQENGRRYLDATSPFYDLVISSCDVNNATVLNVGAGPTPIDSIRKLKGKFMKLVGTDIDTEVLKNTDLDEAYVNDGVHLPFSDNTFDMVYSDWVAEHVEKPEEFLKEIYRVLKPEGSYIFRTVNLYHYVTFISSHSPQWFHKLVANRARKLAADSHDPWPTYYRMNTVGALKKLAANVKFDKSEITLIESSPSYLVFNPIAFLIGVAYERLVNKFNCLYNFRLSIYCKLTK